MLRNYLSNSILTVAISVCLLGTAYAQTNTNWTGAGGDNNWNNAANWSNGIPNNSGQTFNANIDGGNTGASSNVTVFGSAPDILISNLTIDQNDSLTLNNNTLLSILDNLDNFGTLTLAPVNATTVLEVGDGFSFTGNGTIRMNSGSRSFLASANTSGTGLESFSIGAGQLIEGGGSIGENVSTITNNGTIESNQVGFGGFILIDPGAGGFINNGTLRAATNANGTPELQLSDGVFTNNGTIESQDGTRVSLRSDAVIRGGTLQTAGSGIIAVQNGQSATIGGSIVNNGNLVVNVLNSPTTLNIEDGTSLAGTGALILDSTFSSLVIGDTASASFTIGAGQTVQGSGQFGVDSMISTNNGVFDANNTGQSNLLTIDPNDTTSPNFGFTNNNLLRASGGGALRLLGGRFDNTNGTIEAGSGSTVFFNNSEIIGGTFLSSGDGTGIIETQNGTTATIGGAIANNATLRVGTVNAPTTMLIKNGTNLSGDGTLRLLNGFSSFVEGENGGDTFTIGANQTIAGGGEFGNGTMTVINNGTFDADLEGLAGFLNVRPGSGGLTNNGLMKASAGGILDFTGGNIDNTNGVIRSDTDSDVRFNGGRITGGTIEDGGGIVYINNNNTGTFAGNINNEATVAIGLNNGGTLNFDDGAIIDGPGAIDLEFIFASIISTTNASDTFTNGASHLIRGRGVIGNQNGNMINLGTIRSDDSSLIQLNPGSFENLGTVEVHDGSVLSISNSYVQNGGLTSLLDGTIDSTATLEINSGILEGSGDINGSVLLSGELQPGYAVNVGPIIGLGGNDAAGELEIDELEMLAGALASIELGGFTPGSDFDFVDVIGDLTLGGDLSLNFINGFESTVLSSDQFTIFDSNGLTGSFANVASGDFLTTDDGLGVFQVFYGAGSPFDNNSVVLGNFSAVPEPSTSLVLIAAGIFGIARRRRTQ